MLLDSFTLQISKNFEILMRSKTENGLTLNFFKNSLSFVKCFNTCSTFIYNFQWPVQIDYE